MIAGKGKLPKFTVKWAAKGGIVDGATLIGAGEKGSEAIVPLDPFWNKMDAMANSMGGNADAIVSGLIEALSRVTLVNNLNVDGRNAATVMAPFIRPELNKIDARNNRKLGYV